MMRWLTQKLFWYTVIMVITFPLTITLIHNLDIDVIVHSDAAIENLIGNLLSNILNSLG
jgi:hypothetical protein